MDRVCGRCYIRVRLEPGRKGTCVEEREPQETQTGASSWKRRYYTILAGQAISQAGSSAVQFALIWHLAQQTGSPSAMGLAGLAAYLPGALLSPVAGIVADRYSRKRVCMAADLAAGIMAALFALALGHVGVSVSAVIVLLAARACATAFQAPAMQAMVPDIVPQDALIEAGGMAQALTSASLILGPVIGGALYAARPLPFVLLTDLLGALAAVGTLAAVFVPDHLAPGPRPALHPLRELEEGLAVFWEDRLLRQVIVSFLVLMVFMPLSSFYPLMTSSYFGLGAVEGSVVEMVWSLGMLLAGVAIAKAKLDDEIRASYVAGALIGATCIGCGLVPASYGGWIAFSVLCAGMGAASTCYDVPIVAYLQKTVPQARQGRAFSAFQIVSLAAMPAGLAIASPVAEALGVNAWFGVSGVAILLLCLVMLVLERRLRARL